MPDTVTKTLTYCRAKRDEAADPTFQSQIEAAHKKIKKPDDRVVTYGRQRIKGLLAIVSTTGGHVVHIASYVESQVASTVPKRTKQEKAALGTAKPPANQEFMDGDLLALVVGNDIVLCTTRLREKAFLHYCNEIFRQSGAAAAVGAWHVGNVANVDKVKFLQAHGARSITLDVGLFGATIDHEDRKTEYKALRGGILDTIVDFLRKDDETKDIAAKADLEVQLVLSFNTRKRKQVAGAAELQDMATSLLQDGGDESFVINTPNGKIWSSELRQATKVSLPVQGSSIRVLDAIREMETFYQQLRNDGLLER